MGTYTPTDAVTLVQKYAHGIPLDTTLQANVCDIVNSMMWMVYPWSWSVQNFTAITCIQGQQDYNVVDTNVLRPLVIRLVRTDITPNEYRELSLLANLPVEVTRTGGLDTITSAGYFASGPFIRLLYAAAVSGTEVMQIQGFYQKQPTKITSGTMSTPFAFPDQYFDVFVEGLKWKIYQLEDDQRAGAIQYSKNGSQMRVYTGQLGLFLDQLREMARTEDLQTGDEFSFPEQALGVGRSYWPGLYGV